MFIARFDLIGTSWVDPRCGDWIFHFRSLSVWFCI